MAHYRNLLLSFSVTRVALATFFTSASQPPECRSDTTEPYGRNTRTGCPRAGGHSLRQHLEEADYFHGAGNVLRIRVFVKTALLAGLKKRDAESVAGEPFWVVKVGPDDTGTCTVTLARGQPGKHAPLREGRMR